MSVAENETLCGYAILHGCRLFTSGRVHPSRLFFFV